MKQRYELVICRRGIPTGQQAYENMLKLICIYRNAYFNNNEEYERGDIITDAMGIKRIIKEYQKQLQAHKFDNLDEMDLFLERDNVPNSRKIMSLYISPNQLNV